MCMTDRGCSEEPSHERERPVEQLTWAPEKLARRLIGGSFTSPRAVTAPCAHPNGTTSATLTALIVHIATELMRYNNGPQ
jgi:hypothetical protein